MPKKETPGGAKRSPGRRSFLYSVLSYMLRVICYELFVTPQAISKQTQSPD
jgi:hypothetical protein